MERIRDEKGASITSLPTPKWGRANILFCQSRPLIQASIIKKGKRGREWNVAKNERWDSTWHQKKGLNSWANYQWAGKDWNYTERSGIHPFKGQILEKKTVRSNKEIGQIRSALQWNPCTKKSAFNTQIDPPIDDYTGKQSRVRSASASTTKLRVRLGGRLSSQKKPPTEEPRHATGLIRFWTPSDLETPTLTKNLKSHFPQHNEVCIRTDQDSGLRFNLAAIPLVGITERNHCRWRCHCKQGSSNTKLWAFPTITCGRVERWQKKKNAACTRSRAKHKDPHKSKLRKGDERGRSQFETAKWEALANFIDLRELTREYE